MKKKIILVYISIIFFSLGLLAQETIDSEEKRILILFSGSHDSLVNRNMYLTFEEVLSPNNIKVFSEYMGNNDSVYLSNKEAFIDYFKLKYGENRKFDLVLAFNKKAITLCEENGREIFPNTDILIIDIFGQVVSKPPTITQLQIIKNLHKDLENLLIVSDGSVSGKLLKQDLTAYIDSTGMFQDQVVYIDFANLNYADIQDFKRYTEKESVILLLSANQDASLKMMEFREQTAFLHRELNLPIYTVYEKNESADVVGGHFLDIENVVKQLSVKAILILNNMPIEQVNFNDIKFYKMFFNQAVVDAYDINIHQYRDEAIIITSQESDNKRNSVSLLEKKLLILSVITLLGLLIYSFSRNSKYKKEAEKFKLILDEIFDNSVQYIFIIDTKTKVILDYNQKVAKSDFCDEIIKNESKVTDFFPAQIYGILEQKKYNYRIKTYEIDFSSSKANFPTVLTSLTYFNGQKDIAYLQFFDHSEYRQELDNLHKLTEEAEKKSQQSKHLMSNIVREIRSPLGIKNGFEKLLEDEDLPVQERSKYLKIIHTNSFKLINIIEKIHIFSDLSNNTRILNNREFSLNKSIRKITNKIQNRIKDREQNIRLVNYFSLSEGKDVIFNDQTYFSLVFSELLDNAVKFTQGGVIECGYTHPNDGKIIFYVKDTGIGMTLDEQREAFNKYTYQTATDKHNTKSGLGVGLAICRNLINKMGGNIWLSSTKNEETTVYFYLDYDMSIFNDAQKQILPSDIEKIKKQNILVIDEDMGSQKFITQTLTHHNILAKTMPSYQFYKKYRKPDKKYTFIFIDYNSGFEELLTENKAIIIEHNISLVIMTREFIDENISKELKGINYDIIFKPLKLQDILRALIKLSK